MRFPLVLVLVLLLWLGPAGVAAEDTGFAGRRLVDVLRELRHRGLDVVFSSAVVNDEMRVATEPDSTEPRAILGEILPPLGLRAEAGPAGTLLILPAATAPETGQSPSGHAPTPLFVTELVVTPSQHSIVREEQSSARTLTNEETVLAPTIGGDITRVIELLPGVAAADNSAAFNVRGSVVQDFSMVLDGLELYDPFHLQSLQSPFSLIDSNVVDRIDFFGGGFTADLGDRHGGFVEISTIAPEQLGGEVEIGTLNSRFSYRTPSWLVSVRGWYPESIIDQTELGGGEKLDPRFADLYAKGTFNVGNRHRLSVHGLTSYDRLSFLEGGEVVNEAVEAITRNSYLWLRAISAWTGAVTSETILSGGRIERIRDGIASVQGAVTVEDRRTVDFYGLKNDSMWRISGAHVLKAGAEVRWLTADYRYDNVVSGDPSQTKHLRLGPKGTSLGLYVSHRARLTQRLATELGARWDRQTYTNDNQISPRFNAVWRPAERTELRLALGRFHQSQRIHELHVEDGESGFGTAEVAEQVELSARHTFASGPRIRFDAYDRKLSQLRPRYENLFEPVELFPEVSTDRVPLTPDRARLRGVELLVRGDLERPLYWSVSYTLSSADDDIDGKDVPRSWDQTHAGKFLIGYRREGKWSVSLSGTAHTGWPTTPGVAEVQPDGSVAAVPGPRNTDRFATYVRFDFKTRWAFAVPRGKLWLTAEVLNLTDRDNACCLDEFFVETDAGGAPIVRRRNDYWLGTTPSVSLLWEF